MSEYSIRAATVEDAEQLMNLRKRIDKDSTNKSPPLDPYGGDYPTIKQQQLEIKECTNKAIFLVAVSGQIVIGTAYCFPMPDAIGEYALKFIVDKSWRGKGVASKLVAAIIQWATTNSDARKLICRFNKSQKVAKRILEKFGFSTIKQGLVYYMQGGMYNAIDMSLDLKK
jgi:GNAT superfamily N-acetyltransferase